MKLLEKYNIKPNNEELYIRALTHSSYANENNLGIEADYERLEFLGDAVLDLVVSSYLYKNEAIAEGDMTKERAAYVCENALYEYAKELNLSEYLKLGKGEEASGGRERKTILADSFEALIGAIYIDQGYEEARKFIYRIVIPHVRSKEEDYFKDYKSLLQEQVQTEKKSVYYELKEETGPAHDKSFTVLVKVDNLTLGKGKGKTKKEAEQNAAQDALNKCARNS